jgi:heat shock protein HtpX
MGNTFKTALLLTALTLFLLFMGQVFGGQRGLVMAFGLAIVMNFVSYFFSDKIALKMYRAQPVTREQLPRAYAVVERLTQKMGIPMPQMYVIPTDSPNAFATGRNPNHASVAVTEGILSLLNDEELEGVLAHELGHVRNRDILISSVAATLAGAITLLARMGYWASLFGGTGDRDDRDRGGGFVALLMLILAPIAATLIQLAVSRSREYQAEEAGLLFKTDPYAGIAFDGAPVHCGAPAGRHELRQPVLNSSAYRKAHRAVDRSAGRVGLLGERLCSVNGTT